MSNEQWKTTVAFLCFDNVEISKIPLEWQDNVTSIRYKQAKKKLSTKININKQYDSTLQHEFATAHEDTTNER